jgi:hypothetical protein
MKRRKPFDLFDQIVIFTFLFLSIFLPLYSVFEIRDKLLTVIFLLSSFIFLLDFLRDYFFFKNSASEEEFVFYYSRREYYTKFLLFDILSFIPVMVFPTGSIFVFLPLLKIFKIFGNLSNWKQSSIRFSLLSTMMIFLFWFLQVTNWTTCGWLAIDGINKDLTHVSNYISALYWTATTLTTVGYGDIVPSTDLEKLYSVLVMILGVGFYGYLIGNVASVLSKKDPAKEYFVENMERLSTLVKYRNITPAMANKIRRYFTYLWKHKLNINEDEFINQLPYGLKLELLSQLREEVLKKVELFRNADKNFLEALSLKLKPLALTPDDVLFKVGDDGDKMYFVVKGNLSIIKNSTEVAEITEGDFVGEIALFRDVHRTATVIAKNYCQLYSLDKNDFSSLIKKYPDISKKIESKMNLRETSLQ